MRTQLLEKSALDLIDLLQETMASGSPKAFMDVIEKIDWDTLPTPTPIKEAVDLALKKGYHTLAVKLAAKGHQLFPEDTDLQKVAKVLAPSKVIRTGIPPVEGLQESMKWLKENRNQYKGQWVAVKDGILLGHAQSRARLSEMLADLDISDTIITKVPDYPI